PYDQVDIVERSKAAEALADARDLEQRLPGNIRHERFLRRHASTHPMIPFGASVTNATSSTPTISRFHADEMVTCTICCTEPRSTAPITGPTQLIMPPISGIAMLFTAYERLNAALGSMYAR